MTIVWFVVLTIMIIGLYADHSRLEKKLDELKKAHVMLEASHNQVQTSALRMLDICNSVLVDVKEMKILLSIHEQKW